MRKATMCGLGLALLVFTTGCGDSPEKVTKDVISNLNDLSAVLEKVDSDDAAEKAVSQIEKLAKKQKEIGERAKKLKLDDLPKDKQEALEKKFKDDLTKAGTRFGVAMVKAGQYKAIQKPLEEFMSAMAEGQPKKEQKNKLDVKPKTDEK